MKKIFSYFVAFMLCALYVGELSVVQPDRAEAGVLTRGGASNGLGIRVPRARDRSVRKSTSALKSTNPNLEYRGVPIVEAYRIMAQKDKKYAKKLSKWERKVERIQLRAAKKREKEERARLKKERKLAAKNRSTSRSGGSYSEASVATDPRAWFTRKIMRRDDGGSLSLSRAASKSTAKSDASGRTGDQRGTELNVEPAKKNGFWQAIWRALGGS